MFFPYSLLASEWHGGGQVAVANDAHAIVRYGLIVLCKRCIASGSSGQVDDHGSIAHSAEHGFGDEYGRFLTGYLCGGDDDIGFGNAFGDLLLLASVCSLRFVLRHNHRLWKHRQLLPLPQI